MLILNLGNFIVNNYVISLPEGYMLVDTGYENGYNALCHKLAKNNIQLKDIHYIFLTHAHDDHAGFLNEFLSANTQTKVILHPKAVAGLRRGQNSFEGGCSNRLAFLFCKAMALVGKKEHKFPMVNERFEENYIFFDSPEAKKLEKQFSMKFIETPGHTDCSISLLWNDAIFCGDAAMNGMPSCNKITIWIENLAEYQSLWKKIIELRPYMIYPGHGKPFAFRELSRNIEKINNRNLLPLF